MTTSGSRNERKTEQQGACHSLFDTHCAALDRPHREPSRLAFERFVIEF
jgi:hypothetical protein